MSESLNSLKGLYGGIYEVPILHIELMQGDTGI